MTFAEELIKYSNGRRATAEKAGIILLAFLAGLFIAGMFLYSAVADLFQ